MNVDWNPVIHVLDELSDGTHSFLELSYIAPHYKYSFDHISYVKFFCKPKFIAGLTVIIYINTTTANLSYLQLAARQQDCLRLGWLEVKEFYAFLYSQVRECWSIPFQPVQKWHWGIRRCHRFQGGYRA